VLRFPGVGGLQQRGPLRCAERPLHDETQLRPVVSYQPAAVVRKAEVPGEIRQWRADLQLLRGCVVEPGGQRFRGGVQLAGSRQSGYGRPVKCCGGAQHLALGVVFQRQPRE